MAQKKADVNECLSMYSNYAYFDGIKYNLDTMAIFKKYEEIEREFLIGNDIVKADLYLAEIVGRLSFSDAAMVLEELKMLKANPKYEKVILPPCKLENVKRGLKRLCRHGLARCFSYKAPAGIEIQMYCLSETGLHLVRKVIYSKLRTEETMLALEPAEEAFRRLVANYCGQVIRRRYQVADIRPGTRVYIPKMGRKYIYGHYEYTSEEGKQNVLLVEPMYYHADEKIVTQERIAEHNAERINILNAYIEKLKSERENLEVKVIFIFEDKKGLLKITPLVINNLDIIISTATNDIKYALENGEPCTITATEMSGIDNVCFTSEPLLYNMPPGEEFLGINNVKDGKAEYRRKYQIKR